MNVAVTFNVLVVLTPAIEHDHVVCKLKHTTTEHIIPSFIRKKEVVYSQIIRTHHSIN